MARHGIMTYAFCSQCSHCPEGLSTAIASSSIRIRIRMLIAMQATAGWCRLRSLHLCMAAMSTVAGSVPAPAVEMGCAAVNLVPSLALQGPDAATATSWHRAMQLDWYVMPSAPQTGATSLRSQVPGHVPVAAEPKRKGRSCHTGSKVLEHIGMFVTECLLGRGLGLDSPVDCACAAARQNAIGKTAHNIRAMVPNLVTKIYGVLVVAIEGPYSRGL